MNFLFLIKEGKGVSGGGRVQNMSDPRIANWGNIRPNLKRYTNNKTGYSQIIYYFLPEFQNIIKKRFTKNCLGLMVIETKLVKINHAAISNKLH